jgi:hypothetical protein
VAGGVSETRADVLLDGTFPVVTQTAAGTYLYTYNPVLTSQTRFDAGDYFTFYDFGGFVRVTSAPATFTFTTQPVGPSPVVTLFGNVIPNDDPSITNVTFTFLDGPIIGGPIPLGTFQIESLLPPGTLKSFAATSSQANTGLQNGNVTNYLAPVPEPGEWAVGGIFAAGLAGLVLRARRRQRAAVSVSVPA